VPGNLAPSRRVEKWQYLDVSFGARAFVLLLCLAPSSCDSECGAKPCGAVDRSAERGDYAVELDTETGFAAVEFGGQSSDFGLTGGEFVFTTLDSECAATPETPCTIVLERLRIELSSFTQPTSEGDLQIDEPVISVRAPIELVDSGGGFFLDAETTGTQICSTVNGTRDSATLALSDPASMNVDIPRQTFSLEGQFPLRFRAGSDGCETIDGSATVVASGRSPWAQRP
jgi:hypothetical protein